MVWAGSADFWKPPEQLLKVCVSEANHASPPPTTSPHRLQVKEDTQRWEPSVSVANL